MWHRRLVRGFVWGVLATIAMSIPMILGFITGIAPMPQPIPLAVTQRVLGEALSQPLAMVIALGSHLVYGGFWAAVLAEVTQPITILKGVGLGVFLWFLMQIIFLPLIGWGFFGIAIAPSIAVATLFLHLVYGVTLGWIADREAAVFASS